MPEIIGDLVSTVIPAYNRPIMLREAVASVLAQTYRSIEIIIVDDGSSDDTPQVAEHLAKTHRDTVVFIRKSNSGPGPTREAGRQIARGELIQNLDSDDLLRPRKFEIQGQADARTTGLRRRLRLHLRSSFKQTSNRKALQGLRRNSRDALSEIAGRSLVEHRLSSLSSFCL